MASRIPLRLSTQRPLVSRVSIHARYFADKQQPPPPQPAAAPGSPAHTEEVINGGEIEPLPHVSEEAAALSKSKGETGPELEQGTKVQDMVKGDKEAMEHLPQVMKDQLKKSGSGQQSRGYSTIAWVGSRTRFMASRAFSTTTASRFPTLNSSHDGTVAFGTEAAGLPNARPQHDASENVQFFNEAENEEEEEDDDDGEFEYDPDEDELQGGLVARHGNKFGAIELPLPAGSHLRRRYDTLVEQVTKLLMRHGKLSVAQRNMANILTHLRTAPAPRASAKYPLIPGAPPHSDLPLNPTLYLSVALDSVAPVFRIRSQRGAAGGGVALQLPVPLRQRQRRRTAVMWILDAVEKRKGGTSDFSKRFAEEIVSIVEGRSGCWAKRDALHALGIRARSNLGIMARGSGVRKPSFR